MGLGVFSRLNRIHEFVNPAVDLGSGSIAVEIKSSQSQIIEIYGLNWGFLPGISTDGDNNVFSVAVILFQNVPVLSALSQLGGLIDISALPVPYNTAEVLHFENRSGLTARTIGQGVFYTDFTTPIIIQPTYNALLVVPAPFLVTVPTQEQYLYAGIRGAIRLANESKFPFIWR